MKKLTTEKAQELKRQGYTHLASVLKQVFRTKYYHVVSIDDVIANGGKWVPADKNATRDKLGIIGTKIDWSITALTTDVL